MPVEEANLGAISLWEMMLTMGVALVGVVLLWLLLKYGLWGLHKLHERYPRYIPDAPEWRLDV